MKKPSPGKPQKLDRTDHEAQRLLALRRFGVLDTAPEAIFDNITNAIANICEVPMALISLVDNDRQWFKSAYGLDVKETPREIAFCSHAIEDERRLCEVKDVAADSRFADNPLVVGEPGIRFYAGSPLVSYDGFAIGTLCVLDRVPRELNPHQRAALAALSDAVIAIMEDRKRLQLVAVDRNAVEDLLQAQLETVRRTSLAQSEFIAHTLARHEHPAAVVFRMLDMVKINRSWAAQLSGEANRDEYSIDEFVSSLETGNDNLRSEKNEIVKFLGKIAETEQGEISEQPTVRSLCITQCGRHDNIFVLEIKQGQ